MWGRYEGDKASMGSEVLAKFAGCGADINYILSGAREKAEGPSFEERLRQLQKASDRAALLGDTREEQLALQEKFFTGAEMVAVPCLKQCRQSGGDPCLEEDHLWTGLRHFDREWLRQLGDPDQMALLRYDRDDMEPEIRPGDLVLFEKAEGRLWPGDLHVLGFGHTLCISRLVPGHDGFIFSGLSPRYMPFILDDDADEIPWQTFGRVVWWCRSASPLEWRRMK
jgi:hypothetical protein